MNKSELLKAATEAVTDRGEEYGSVERNFKRIADRWSLHMQQHNHDSIIEFTPRDVAMMMIETKLARLAHSPDHMDSVVDIAGYAACLAELITKEKEPKQ